MLILFETPAGFALFKVLKPGKLAEVDDVFQFFSSPAEAAKSVKLEAFHKFKDSTEALKAVAKMLKGQIPKSLNSFLQENVISKEIQDTIVVGEKKLASAINAELGLDTQSDERSIEIMRGIRAQLFALLKGVSEADFKAMSLGLAHSISRYRLKFSAEKVDVMIIQAISLLDDLDKELNNYAMRLKEWYSWHFPELIDIVSDYLLYAKVVKEIGMRTNIREIDLKSLIPEDIEKEIHEAAEKSMGTEISADDENHIKDLATQVIEMYEYRESLSNYLKARMAAVAPNLSAMVGEIVGSRLIAKAGSLVNLAKLPSSTVQILGAEKALFKAMRTKHNTPKYGLIYHASLVGAAPVSVKGKVSRSLAAKCALCIRFDALGESPDGAFGTANKAYIEAKIKQLESVVGKAPAPAKPVQKYAAPTQGAKAYNPASDFPAVSAQKRAKPETTKTAPKMEPKTKKKLEDE